MCNGWNHDGGCECGFGPPYVRDVPDYFDHYVGDKGGRDLSSAGPHSAGLGSRIDDKQLTTQLVSTFLWQSFIGSATTEWVGEVSKARRAAKSPVIYVVRHGRGYPRHDLLVFDSRLPHDKVEQGYVDISPAELRRGWRNFSDAYGITSKSMPEWLSGLSMEDIAEIGIEAMNVQRHFFIAMHPLRIVWTSGVGHNLPQIPSPALAVSNKKGKSLSTAGVISADHQGRRGVTTALHAVEKFGMAVFVQGAPGNVRARDTITDSCFIEMKDSQLPSCGPCRGPLSGVTPGRGEDVWFDGAISGRVTTHIDGWTPELPWLVPDVQSRIITPAVTNGGDSGAALVSKAGLVIGFAYYRTGFNAKSPHSAWIWAEFFQLFTCSDGVRLLGIPKWPHLGKL